MCPLQNWHGPELQGRAAWAGRQGREGGEAAAVRAHSQHPRHGPSPFIVRQQEVDGTRVSKRSISILWLCRQS